MTSHPNFTIAAILDAHRSGAASPAETVAASYARIRAHGDPAVFITLRDEAEAIAEAKTIAASDGRPLAGVPIAVKDNIDVKGMPTTAACPAFAYAPSQDATCVARLRRAGAIVIGKTNLDQFATGLSGTRTPLRHPAQCRSKAGLIPGGSSSGSAVAVAAGLVPLALGTDTAGSGRIPAALNNIVGLKPSLGLVSTFGAGARLPYARLRLGVRAHGRRRLRGVGRDGRSGSCRSLFARAAARRARPMPRRHQARGADARRPPVLWRQGVGRGLRGRARASCAARREDRRDRYRAVLRNRAPSLRRAVGGGALHHGALADRVQSRSPCIRSPARSFSAGRGRARSTPSRRSTSSRSCVGCAITRSATIDALVLPTMPTAYTVEQVLADPIQLNSRLGTYTNFVNLLELCAARGAGVDA